MLEKWYLRMENADAVIKHIPSDSVDHQFLPFVGDGYVGLTTNGEKSELYILNDTKMGLIKIPFSNLLQFNPMGETKDPDETIVLDIKNGKIHKFTTFNGDNQVYCIVVEHIIFVHRDIPGLLYQEVKINNFRPTAVHGVFSIQTSDKWHKEVITSKGSKLDSYSLSYGVESSKARTGRKVIAVATSLFPKESKLAGRRSVEMQVTSLIRTDDLFVEQDKNMQSEAEQKAVVDRSLKKLKSEIGKVWGPLIQTPLQKTHILAWKSVWNLGIRIESKDDPDTPSPLNVNITEYYLYSTNVFKNDSLASIPESKTESCFYGAPTMHTTHFWVMPKDIASLISLTSNWNNTLYKFGCGALMKAGVFGIQRALVLSFSGLQYTKHGLELAINPISLSSNVSLRHLPYHKNTIYIHIRIMPPDGIKTIEIFSENSKAPKLYACGSACEHVVEISSTPSLFLAKLTNPVTPILYVSTNRSELLVIKESSFMINALKETHEDDQPRFAAHHFKLSAKFWLIVILSIVFFHVIVIKMIYAECHKDKGAKRNRGRAFVS
eukprot:gene12626-3332_t